MDQAQVSQHVNEQLLVAKIKLDLIEELILFNNRLIDILTKNGVPHHNDYIGQAMHKGSSIVLESYERNFRKRINLINHDLEVYKRLVDSMNSGQSRDSESMVD